MASPYGHYGGAKDPPPCNPLEATAARRVPAVTGAGTRSTPYSLARFLGELRGRRSVRSFGIVAIALALVLVACAPAKEPPPPPPPCPGCTVYLTFDDGPGVYTPQILSVLAAKGAPATFFVVGEHAAQFPSLVQQEHAGGHGIGVHGWSHAALTELPPDQIRQELESTAVEIASLTGTRPTLWRPPFGSFNGTVTAIASSLGLSLRLWDVNPSDFTLPGTDVIISSVVDNVSDGAIVPLHDSSPDGSEDRSQTVAALPTIIDTLRARGFEFGTLSTTTGALAGPTGPDVVIGQE
jgi:peptidoglycan/xylan/chitin deacetylase (PgdA/CDA1 family)